LKTPFDVAYYSTRPVEFFRDLTGEEPWPWQVDVLSVLANPGTVRHIAIGSGHGVGKSTLLAVIAWYWFLTRYPSLTAITAPTARQVQRVLFREIRRLYTRLPADVKKAVDATTLTIAFKDDASNLIIGSTAKPENADAFQGYHSKNMLMLVDESSGIHPAIWEAMVGVFSTEGAIGIYTGNQTKTSGEFFEMMNSPRFENNPQYYRLVVNSEDVPGAQQIVQAVKDRYPGDEDKYRVRVLGLPPRQGEDSLVSRENVLACAARGKDPEAVRTAWLNSPYYPVWGLDVAHKGKCSTVLMKRTGYVLDGNIQSWRGLTNPEVAEIVASEYYRAKAHEKPHTICVDRTSLGAGVVDLLRREGVPVKGVSTSESSTNKSLYHRLRDELWWRAKIWLDSGSGVFLSEHEQLIKELIAPTFTMESKLRVETKKDFEERLGYSPDFADAFVLTFGQTGEIENPAFPFHKFGAVPPTGFGASDKEFNPNGSMIGRGSSGGSWLAG